MDPLTGVASGDVRSNFRCRPESRPSCPNVRISVDCFRFAPESRPGAEGPFSSPNDPFQELMTI